jgi:hypothetical protein
MSDVENLTARVAALEALLQRICSVPMVAMSLGAETVIRNSVVPATPEHRPGGSLDKPHPMDEALRRGDKLAALAKEIGK